MLLDKKFWKIKNITGKGRGIFAKKIIPAGRIVGDYIGKVLRTRDIDLATIKDNLFLMYYSNEASIYPDLNISGIHLINHSCSPNSWIYTHRGHTLVFALRDIEPDEEITIDYLLPPTCRPGPCAHICECGSANCKGTFHLTESEFKKWRKFQNGIEKKDKKARIKYGETLKLLSNYPKRVLKSYIESTELFLKT